MRFPLIATFLLFLLPNLKAQKSQDSLRQIINSESNDSLKIMAYTDLSNELIKEPKKVLEILSEMILYSEKIKSDKYKALCLRKIGAIYSYHNHFDKALEYTYRAADLFEKVGDKYGLAYCYNNIGNFYNYKGEFTKDSRFQERSAEYHLKSIALRDTIRDTMPLMNSYNNIGNTYKELKNYTKALKYYNKSYSMALRSGDHKFVEMISDNLGSCYLTLGENEKKPALLKQALFYYLNVLKNYHGNNPSRAYATVHTSVGKIYTEMGNTSLGLSYLEKGFEMSKLVHDKSAIMHGAINLSNAYEKKGDYAKALELMHIFNANKDSLVNEKNSNSIEEMQVLYQSSQKDKAIEKLNVEKRATDAELSRQRIIIFSTIGGVLFTLIIALVLWSRFIIKKKANFKLTTAYRKIEIKNQQITDSINYAKRLQTAVFPPIELLEQNLPGFFLLYKPKDIVSGDFYWFSKHKGKLFFIVADCTGHGVPGALMSMVGNTLLNEIINQKNILDPGEILVQLDKGINLALRQQNADILTQDDGMDVSICCIDESDKTTLKYATANHSIFVKNSGGLTELKGDIHSIGGTMGINAKQFTTQEHKISSESYVVLSSDGYYDQFGSGEKGKFLITRFEKLIIDSDLSKNTENVFAKAIDDWKGDAKQTDDILVAGFKIG